MGVVDLREEFAPMEVMQRFFAHAVCEAATSRAPGRAWRSAVRCETGRGRRRCDARVEVARPKKGEVTWSCARCGCGGSVIGYELSASDLSAYVPRAKMRTWGFDDEERELLLDATADIRSLRAVVARATPHTEIPELLLVRATPQELDDMYSLVEAPTDGRPGRKRLAILEGLRRSLCTAIDGF